MENANERAFLLSCDSNPTCRAHKKFDVWANSSTLEDHDFDVKDEDGMALISKEDEPSHTGKFKLRLTSLSVMLLCNGRCNP